MGTVVTLLLETRLQGVESWLRGGENIVVSAKCRFPKARNLSDPVFLKQNSNKYLS